MKITTEQLQATLGGSHILEGRFHRSVGQGFRRDHRPQRQRQKHLAQIYLPGADAAKRYGFSRRQRPEQL